MLENALSSTCCVHADLEIRNKAENKVGAFSHCNLAIKMVFSQENAVHPVMSKQSTTGG